MWFSTCLGLPSEKGAMLKYQPLQTLTHLPAGGAYSSLHIHSLSWPKTFQRGQDCRQDLGLLTSSVICPQTHWWRIVLIFSSQPPSSSFPSPPSQSRDQEDGSGGEAVSEEQEHCWRKLNAKGKRRPVLTRTPHWGKAGIFPLLPFVKGI